MRESNNMIQHDLLTAPDHEVDAFLDELERENDCVSFGAPMIDLAFDEMKWQKEYICIDSAFRIV